MGVMAKLWYLSVVRFNLCWTLKLQAEGLVLLPWWFTLMRREVKSGDLLVPFSAHRFLLWFQRLNIVHSHLTGVVSSEQSRHSCYPRSQLVAFFQLQPTI